MPTYRLEVQQQINASSQEVWDFISSPANLKQITPPHMGFDILTPGLPEKMYEGMMIEYKVWALPFLPTKWLTEITHIKELEYFVDEQRAGPYKLWHHEHHLKPIENGVLMTDIVHYIPPMGPLGAIANKILISGQLEKIFEFREGVIDERFG
ncbi:MAG: SRPBCC family protein [Bacteroidota bacterium]